MGVPKYAGPDNPVEVYECQVQCARLMQAVLGPDPSHFGGNCLGRVRINEQASAYRNIAHCTWLDAGLGAEHQFDALCSGSSLSIAILMGFATSGGAGAGFRDAFMLMAAGDRGRWDIAEAPGGC